jgi:hypothetical protein
VETGLGWEKGITNGYLEAFLWVEAPNRGRLGGVLWSVDPRSVFKQQLRVRREIGYSYQVTGDSGGDRSVDRILRFFRPVCGELATGGN